MISQLELEAKFSSDPNAEYICLRDINIYDSPLGQGLATQAAQNRHLKITSLESENNTSIKVQLCEDKYPGWLRVEDLSNLQLSANSYEPVNLSREDFAKDLPQVIEFIHEAMKIPNEYLWGGTVAPNYDCSGLMQAAFLSIGVWLPRDAYQQEAFTQPIEKSELKPADLIFFGTPQKATHVALYLGEDKYIHSSGKSLGRNGIGIDILSENASKVSQNYYKQLRGFGRVMKSFI